MAQAELKVIAKLDSSQVASGLSSMSSQLSGMKGMIAGAFGVGAILSFGKNLLRTADDMAKIAGATNLTLGKLVALKTVAAENNVNMEGLSLVLGKVRDAQGKVVSLSPEMIKALAALKINAEEFIGAGTDEALAMIAKGYVDAKGSAEAYSAVIDILGKSGGKSIDMLKALAGEGLAPLAERTKDATDGFNALAAAQGNIEKFFNSIQIGAGAAIGKVMQLGEELGKLSVEKPKQGVIASVFEGIGNIFYQGKFDQDILGKKTKASIAKKQQEEIAKKDVAPEKSSDLAAFAENKRKARENEMDAALRADEKLSAKEADYNERQDEIAIEYQKKLKDIESGKSIGIPGMARVDSLQAIGGIVGGVAGRGDQAARIAERQAKTQEAIQNLLQETNTKFDQLNRKLDGIISE